MSHLLMLAACAALQAEWPTYHGGYTLDGVAAVAPPDSPVLLWKFKAARPITATPVSAGERVFFTTDKGGLAALDLRGREVWKIEIPNNAFSTPPLFAGEAVIVGSGTGVLHAFDAATGKERWNYKVSESLHGTANRVDLPGGRKGIIAISQADGAIHCVDLETGKAEWKTGALDRCDGSAGVGNGHIVMGSCASALHVFTFEKGEKGTDIDLGEDGQVAAGVALSGKLAFAGTRGGKLHAVDVAAGKVVWTNRDCKAEAFTTPAVNDRFVLFGADDDKIYALKRDTGEKVWDFNTGGKPSSPAIAGNRGIVASGGSLFLLDLETGRKIWTVRVSDEITSPAIVGGMILVGADDGTVSAFGKPQ